MWISAALLLTVATLMQVGSPPQTMCNMLAASRHGEPAGGAPSKLSLADVVALAPLLPLNTAFQLLTKPLLDRGIGLRLKRAHISHPDPDPDIERSPDMLCNAAGKTAVQTVCGEATYCCNCTAKHEEL